MDPSLAGRARRRLLAGLLTAAGALLCEAALVATARAAASDSMTITFRPRDLWPPAPITDLTGLPGVEGQMQLQWTAPDSNLNAFATRTRVAGYQIRIASFSVDSVGGSTTTWWGLATDVRSLPAPAVGGNPPTPGQPGSVDFMLLSQLEPGVTFYALAVSSDSVGQYSDADVQARTPGGQARALIYDAVPPAPASIVASTTGPNSILVSWPAVAAYDLDFYRLYVDATGPYDFADAYALTVDSPTTSATLTGLSPGTYAFRVSAVDKGRPGYAGDALESPATSSTTATLPTPGKRPQAPFGVALSSAGSQVTLRWMPVPRYEDGTPFANPDAATPDELTGYLVYRATSATLGGWTQQSPSISSSTLVWTDFSGGSTYYYNVRSSNTTGLSDRSVIRSVGTLSAFVVAPDDRSYFEVLRPSLSPIEGTQNQPLTAYLVEASSRPQDLGGRVVQSLDFSAKQGGAALTPNFAVPGLGRLKLRYELAALAAASPPAAVPATPNNLGVYWYNGVNWVQMYGRIDQTDQTLNLETIYFGRYQLRFVERAGGVLFDQGGISNRFVTPNGDGKNDGVVFTYDSGPNNSSVNIRIMDRLGRVVAADLPTGPISNSRVWHPQAGVPGGVYIYQIEVEGRVVSGTIVIIK